MTPSHHFPPVRLEAILPPVLRDLNAVVGAVITRDGVLLDANVGFVRLLPGGASAAAGLDVRDIFLNPRFDQFAARSASPEDGCVYRGILNMGHIDSDVRSLRGTVAAYGNDLLLIAEHDVAGLERRVAAMATLNAALAESRREIGRLHRKVEYLESVTTGAIADREALLNLLSRKH